MIEHATKLKADFSEAAKPLRTMLGNADPLLSWMIFTSLSVLVFILLWFYGLAQRAITADHTHITPGIGIIYIAASLHCLWRCLVISREADAERRLGELITGGRGNRGGQGLANAEAATAAAGGGSNDGLVAEHVRELEIKAKFLGPGQRFDQTLLLRVLAERLRGSNEFGAFASDLVMKLGLFGTIVGFIIMLAPIAGLDTENQAAIKSSMALMSDGMAVAMYTTLAGLVGSILIKIQYQFVEVATARLFAAAVGLTEVHVVPALERRAGAAR
jgi:hypothetical protein